MKYYHHRDIDRTFLRVLPNGGELFHYDGSRTDVGTVDRITLDVYYIEISKAEFVKGVLKNG